MSIKVVGYIWFSVAGLTVVAGGLQAETTVPPGVSTGAYYPDEAFPEFMPMWREGWSWKDEAGQTMQYAHADMPLGGYLFAYFRNASKEPLKVEDVLLEGVSLAGAVAPESPPKVKGDDKYASSLRFSKLPKSELERLVSAGQPVWWKVEPMVIPPGGLGEVTVRLRRQPGVEKLTVAVPSAGKDAKVEIEVGKAQPRFFSISFSPELDRVYAYLRHPKGGLPPSRIFFDGREVTRRCRIAADKKIDTVSVTIELERPLEQGSYHILHAYYPDGSRADAGIGAWHHELVYGMWGCHQSGETPEAAARSFLTDMAEHNINVIMGHCGGKANEFIGSEAGLEYLRSLGMRQMLTWVNAERKPAYYFLTDEPDAGDYGSKMLPPDERIGSLAQWLVDRCKLFRKRDPVTPLLLNIDNTFKPENWYTYAQLSDIPCADPYYQEALQSVFGSDPGNFGPYTKPTYVYAVGEIYRSAGAPDPMHLILHTCRFDFPAERHPFRAPTPEEKRIEVYYSLAAGAKAISYWWYTPYGEYYGAGGDAPEMKALWREIGLVGAEVRTAGPLIVRSCPAGVPVKTARWLWTRTLLVDSDTLLVLVVNDNIACDRAGTVVRPVENARLQVSVPGWIKPAATFELGYAGTADAKWTAGQGTIDLDLGTVEVSRLIVITADAGLRSELQGRYESEYAGRVKRLLSEKN